MNSAVRGRFAPSPSGRMHLGNVFCALMAWLSVRSKGGQMVLRIEDLDPARSKPEYTDALMDDLRWLGLDWDEGPDTGGPHPPYCQSLCGDIYREALSALATRGLTYPCFCTRAELAAQAPHPGEDGPAYRGRCAGLSQEEACARAALRTPALRLRAPDEDISFTDDIHGRITQNLAGHCGDFVIRRADGVAAYQLAVVVDDARMGITEVVRGRDLLDSTPRQLHLHRLLGNAAPRFCHVPLLLAPDGRRLSKRDGDLDMAHLRRHKTAAEILGRLAYWGGLTPDPAPMTAGQLIPLYRADKLPRWDIRLDAATLSALQPSRQV